MARPLLLLLGMHGHFGRISAVILSTLVFVGFATTANAKPRQCEQAAVELDADQQTLSELRKVVTQAKANKKSLREAARELTREIQSETSADKAKQLRTQQSEILDEIETIDRVLPPIESQANALAQQIAQSQRDLSSCNVATN